MRCIGKGAESARMFCGIMNLPPPPTKFSKYNKILLQATRETCEDSMAEAVREAVDENDGKKDIAVAVDDDIIVFSLTFYDHLRRLHCVLSCIQEAGLVLNPKKCYFGATEIKVLGHLVSGKGVKPDPDKLKALLKGDSKFIWEKAQEDSFWDLKSALTSPPVLALYDENAPTELQTDASGYGIGAVLVQQQDGKERVISYASRTLTKAEKNYSTTERECLAAIWAITKFRPYLFGKCFNIITDHHSMCWLANLRDPSG
ncbi:retrovirus-related Pol polyprotein from transposon opus [Trichonephila inaurata madagascariensis]|uniref:Retrovirus-related Pol polyprotein from transposon opus n=1 Tax=Trichonephila inaurata madagascariensis TaxID=2747483 RepID=A0A8X6XZM7_9ARAC|nr:retrovirus-related Pol polyprotein from transposon opus [Trichonephila inaurata madagascariensis]